jgi:hypothetical protein
MDVGLHFNNILTIFGATALREGYARHKLAGGPIVSHYALRQLGSNLLMDNFPPLRHSQSQLESV